MFPLIGQIFTCDQDARIGDKRLGTPCGYCSVHLVHETFSIHRKLRESGLFLSNQ